MDAVHSGGESSDVLGAQQDLILSTLSHDLREPLTTIASIARTLEQHGDRIDLETRTDLARRAADKAEKLGRLVTELLDLTRFRDGVIVMDHAPVQVDAVVERVLGDIDADDRVVVDVPTIVAAIDPMVTARILSNLLRNALEHAGPDATVWLRARYVGAGVEFVVEDDGEGIPEAARVHLFDAFHPSTSATGSGFGLAAVARFVRVLDGTVEVGDRDGGGARFRVWLPARSGAEEDAGEDVLRLVDTHESATNH